MNKEEEYTAKNIIVLSPEEAANRFTWMQANNLATLYIKPLEYIERLLAAGQLAGKSIDWIVDRYLKKTGDTMRDTDFETIHKELQKEEHRK